MYFTVNQECLIALNKVIRKAQTVEREAQSAVMKAESDVRSKGDQIKKLEKEIQNLRELNSSNLFAQYSKITEENAQLIQSKNLLDY